MLKKALIASLICLGGLFSSSAAPTLGGPTLSATGGSTNSSSGGVDTNAVIALIEQYGGGGGVVSNTVVQLTVDTWYTNGQYPVVVEAQIELPNSAALMLFSVKDTNSAVIGYLPGSAAWNEFGNASKYAFATTTATEDNVQSLGGYVPAYAAFRYYASGTTASIYDNAPNGTRLVYFGSGTNSSSGTIPDGSITTNKIDSTFYNWVADGSASPTEVAAIMATNGAAYVTNITIFRSNSIPLLFSNNINLAWSNLQRHDFMLLPEGKFYAGSNGLLTAADYVTVAGSGSEKTTIYSWSGGPAIVPSTNNFTLQSLKLTYDFLPLQAFLTESGEESWSQGLGVPNINISPIVYGGIAPSQRSITNLKVLDCIIESQADCLAIYTNEFVNGYSKNTIWRYAWDCTAAWGVTGGTATNWMVFDDCRFEYLGVVFTNESGAVGASPRMVRGADNQKYIFNNCSGYQRAALVNLFDTGRVEVYGGAWIADQTSSEYVFNPADLIAGYTSVNGRLYSKSSHSTGAEFLNSLTVSNNTTSSQITMVANDGLDPVSAGFVFDPGGLSSGYSGWVFYDFPVFSPAGFVGPFTGNGAGLTNVAPRYFTYGFINTTINGTAIHLHPSSGAANATFNVVAARVPVDTIISDINVRLTYVSHVDTNYFLLFTNGVYTGRSVEVSVSSAANSANSTTSTNVGNTFIPAGTLWALQVTNKSASSRQIYGDWAIRYFAQ